MNPSERTIYKMNSVGVSWTRPSVLEPFCNMSWFILLPMSCWSMLACVVKVAIKQTTKHCYVKSVSVFPCTSSSLWSAHPSRETLVPKTQREPAAGQRSPPLSRKTSRFAGAAFPSLQMKDRGCSCRGRRSCCWELAGAPPCFLSPTAYTALLRFAWNC